MRKLLIFLLWLMLASGVSAQSTPTAEPPVPIILSGHTGGVTALAWSPDGTVLASSSGDYETEDHTIRLWSADGTPLAVLDSSDSTYSLAWSPDGATLATGSERGTISLWTAGGTAIRSFGDSGTVVYTLAWSPDGATLAAGESGGPSRNTVELWNAGGQLLKILTTKYSGGKFFNVGWSPDGQYIVGGAIDYALWRADGTPIFAEQTCGNCTPAWGFGWSPDSRLWAIGNESGVVVVYDVAGSEVARLQNSGNVDALAWSPDGALLAGGSSIWTQDGVTFRQTGGGFNARTTLAWSPTGDLLATSNEEVKQVRLVDRTGKKVMVLPTAARCLAWSPDGRWLATGSHDGTIRLWDIAG